MALRPWRGPLVLEGVQTGDGRVIAEGAVYWPDPPLPLGYLDKEMHGDLVEGAVTIGTIDSITREGGQIIGEGSIDDEIEEGAEVVRRMDAGTAPLGNRWGISIDPDDWEVEVILTEEDDADEVLIIAGASPRSSWDKLSAFVASALHAAAGDPDPGEGGGDEGTTLFEEAADTMLARYTRLRIRGATLVALAAFDGAYIELSAATADETVDEPEPVAAAARLAGAPNRPPAEWFEMPEPVEGDSRLVEQPNGSYAVPLTISDEGLVFGHIAPWKSCHRSYLNECVTAPASSAAYVHFHVGEIVCDDGSRVAAGALTASCDHAAGGMLATEARDHYAHSGMAWADVRASDGEFGVWCSGALRPNVTEDQLRVLRACSLSGDWRRVPGRSGLELVAALAVNSPGFPIAREALAASALDVAIASAPRLYVDDETTQSLVAAGVVAQCRDCAKRQHEASSRMELERMLARLDRLETASAPNLMAMFERRLAALDEPPVNPVFDRMAERAQSRGH